MNLHSPVHPTYHSAGRVAEIAPIYLGSLAVSSAESLFYEQLLSHSPIVGSHRLNNLGLDERDMAIVQSVANCRLITTLQLQRLHFTEHNSPIASARSCRRILKRLTEQKVISRRKRRIGGVRAGSASYVYSIGTVGAKLLETGDKRLHAYTTDPSNYFFDHTMAITELYIVLQELAVTQKLHGLKIQTEPNCWRSFPYSKETLRPDMYLQTVNWQGDEQFSFFIEIDRGTTHLPSIMRKLQMYEAYFHSGVEQRQQGVYPLVVWIVFDEQRQATLQKAIDVYQYAKTTLFVVKTMANALQFIGTYSN